MALQGHVQGILTMDFSPDGYHLATGSEDHSCRIWDLRKRACVYVLPAHKSLISQVMLQRRCIGTACQHVEDAFVYVFVVLLLGLRHRCLCSAVTCD